MISFSKRTTAAVTVFACIFANRDALSLTTDVSQVSALSLNYARLNCVYRQLIHQDIEHQAIVLAHIIASARHAICKLNQTVLAITPTPQTAVALALVQSKVGDALYVMASAELMGIATIGDNMQVQTSRVVHTVTTEDIINGFIPVPVVWQTPFADNNYTAVFAVHDFDSTIDLSVGVLDIHNKTASGMTAVALLAAALPLAQGTLDALDVNTNQSMVFVAPLSTLYQLTFYIASHNTGSADQLLQLNAVYTDGSGLGQQSFAPVLGAVNGNSTPLNSQNFSIPLFAVAGSPIAISAVFLAKVTGTVTSGVFVLGEEVKQANTNATSYLLGGGFEYTPTGSAPMYLDSSRMTGAPDASHAWTGQTSGAIYTPSSAPIVSPFAFDFSVRIVQMPSNAITVVPGDQFEIDAIGVADRTPCGT
jgi:hypothetical protein